MWRLCLATLALLLSAAPSHAHLLNMTKVQVDLAPGDELRVDLQVDLGRAAGGPAGYYRLSQIAEPLRDAELAALLQRLADAVTLRLGARRIALQVVSAELPHVTRDVFLDPLSWPMSHVRLRGEIETSAFDAGASLQAVFESSFRFEEPIALTFMLTPERRSMTRWLVTAQASPPFALRADVAARPATAAAHRWQFVAFGFSHILPKGLDHVLFVLGLFFGARSLRSLLILVTCFTLAHSITLGMASVGIVRLPASVVEPLIAASIVWIGVENLLPARTGGYRPWLVFAFGLLHGLGFASALAELDAPGQSFLWSLLSFNIGIELGQLTVIAIALGLTFWCRDRKWYRRAVAMPASLLAAVIAGLWTVQRIAQVL